MAKLDILSDGTPPMIMAVHLTAENGSCAICTGRDHAAWDCEITGLPNSLGTEDMTQGGTWAPSNGRPAVPEPTAMVVDEQVSWAGTVTLAAVQHSSPAKNRKQSHHHRQQ